MTIRVKRGPSSSIPSLQEGELGYTTDTNDLYIGTNNGNKKYAKQSDLDATNAQLADIAFNVRGMGADSSFNTSEIVSALSINNRIMIPRGLFSVNSFTIKNDKMLMFSNGAKLDVLAGETIKVFGSISADLQQVFTGDGRVVFYAAKDTPSETIEDHKQYVAVGTVHYYIITSDSGVYEEVEFNDGDTFYGVENKPHVIDGDAHEVTPDNNLRVFPHWFHEEDDWWDVSINKALLGNRPLKIPDGWYNINHAIIFKELSDIEGISSNTTFICQNNPYENAFESADWSAMTNPSTVGTVDNPEHVNVRLVNDFKIAKLAVQFSSVIAENIPNNKGIAIATLANRPIVKDVDVFRTPGHGVLFGSYTDGNGKLYVSAEKDYNGETATAIPSEFTETGEAKGKIINDYPRYSSLYQTVNTIGTISTLSVARSERTGVIVEPGDIFLDKIYSCINAGYGIWARSWDSQYGYVHAYSNAQTGFKASGAIIANTIETRDNYKEGYVGSGYGANIGTLFANNNNRYGATGYSFYPSVVLIFNTHISNMYISAPNGGDPLRMLNTGNIIGNASITMTSDKNKATTGIYESEKGRNVISGGSISGGYRGNDGIRRLFFENGTKEIKTGDTITGGINGSTAIVRWVEIINGDWVSGSASGIIYTDPPTGIFYSGETSGELLTVNDISCANVKSGYPNPDSTEPSSGGNEFDMSFPCIGYHNEGSTQSKISVRINSGYIAMLKGRSSDGCNTFDININMDNVTYDYRGAYFNETDVVIIREIGAGVHKSSHITFISDPITLDAVGWKEVSFNPPLVYQPSKDHFNLSIVPEIGYTTVDVSQPIFYALYEGTSYFYTVRFKVLTSSGAQCRLVVKSKLTTMS